MPVLINETPVLQEGECQGALAVFTDIAALREAERASRESEERHKVLAEESPFGILIVQGTKVLYRNRRAEDWWDGGAEIEDAFPFVRDIMHNAGIAGGPARETAIRLLREMDLPASQALILGVLRSHEAKDRLELVWGLPPQFFRELWLLFRHDTSGRVRVAAKRQLAALSGIGSTAVGPKNSVWAASARQEEELAKRWEAWWPENAARFGWWGHVRQGLALKCSASRGVYERHEPIWLTVRVRRESGEMDLPPEVRLVGEYLGSEDSGDRRERLQRGGIAVPLPEAPQGKVVPRTPRAEAVYRIEVQRTGKFDRLGRYRFRVCFVVKTRPGGRILDGVYSAPLTIHVRNGPTAPKWSAPHKGLAMSLHTEHRDVKRGGGFALEIRLKNLEVENALTIPWPIREQEWGPEFRGSGVERDRLLRFLSFALTDEGGQPLDLGSEPEPRGVSPPHSRAQLYREQVKPPPALFELQPGQVAHLHGELGWQGHRLCHLTAMEEPGIPLAARKGGRFSLSVTYEVPGDADFPDRAWRGRLTAGLGPIIVEQHEESRGSGAGPSAEGSQIDEAELDLDAIRLLPR